MQDITDVLNSILSPGPAVFMPIIIFIFCLILKLFSKNSITTLQALKSGIMLGVAFIGMGMIIGFMVDMFAQPFAIIQQELNFGSIDLGWAPMSAISWAWQYAILMFPIQIIINAIMLKLRWTRVLNADMWNVWNKVFTGLIVQYFLLAAGASTGVAVPLALIIGGVMVVFELKNADVMYQKQYAVSNIPNVVTAHSMFLVAPFVHYIHTGLTKFNFFKNHSQSMGGFSQSNSLKMKLVNTLRDNMIVGFILGLIIALITVWFDLDNWVVYVQLPFNVAAALVLFPLVAQLFTKSLVPFGMAIQNIMNTRFNNRELYIGLDWPFLAGNPRLWIVATLLIPFELGFAIIFSFIPNVAMVFPLASLVNVCLVPVLLIICEQNLKTMFVAGVALVPIYLFFGAMTAPAITDLANDKFGQMSSNVKDILQNNPNLDITNSGYEAPIFRWGWSAGLGLLFGQTEWQNIVGIIALPLWILIFSFYYRDLAKKSRQIRLKQLKKENNDLPKELPPVGAKLIKKIFNKK